MEQTINYRGFNIEIIPDDHAESPKDMGNDDVFIVFTHRQFDVCVDGFEPQEIFEQVNETKRWFYDGCHVFPLSAYIHSGVCLSLGNGNGFPDRQWDVSTTGFVLVKQVKGWSWRRDKAREIALCMVEEWNDYLSGNVYGYNVEETGDSCWGFYGDPKKSGCIDDAKSNIDWHIKSKRTSYYQQLKTWIKNRVPLMYRTGLQKEFSY